MPNKNIGKEIAKARENKGLSQRQLANAIGISNAALSKIESGETEIPNPKILKKISKHIDLNYNDMMSMIGLGTKITMLNPFIKNYYEHLKGDKLEDAWIIAKSSIDNNNIMIDNLNNDINNGNLSEEDKETVLETIQDLEYQNTTNKLIIEILDNTRYKEAKNNAKNKNVL
jgi:transcriptional regulator with XRE-family HTH domain